MSSRARIGVPSLRVAMHSAPRMQQAPRIAATPRTRGRKLQARRIAWLRVHPLCGECHAQGRVTAGQEVDHCIPLWAGGADDETNYQTLCKPHHAEKTKREAGERARGGTVG